MIDPIERGDVIQALIDSDVRGYDYRQLEEAIKAIPSADRPKGEWIGGDVPTRCSICGHDWDEYVEGREIWYEGSVPNYCPNCGARMKGASDE